MNKIMDWILGLSLIATFAFVCFVLVGIIVADRPKKSELYVECLETDYDKFECYSMIYGDK